LARVFTEKTAAGRPRQTFADDDGAFPSTSNQRASSYLYYIIPPAGRGDQTSFTQRNSPVCRWGRAWEALREDENRVQGARAINPTNTKLTGFRRRPRCSRGFAGSFFRRQATLSSARESFSFIESAIILADPSCSAGMGQPRSAWCGWRRCAADRPAGMVSARLGAYRMVVFGPGPWC